MPHGRFRERTMEGTFKAEMIFPVTPQYCIRFIENKLAGNRSGKFYQITSSDVKVINRKIISESRNIVMNELKIISDRNKMLKNNK